MNPHIKTLWSETAAQCANFQTNPGCQGQGLLSGFSHGVDPNCSRLSLTGLERHQRQAQGQSARVERQIDCIGPQLL